MKILELLTKEHAVNWKPFVAEYVSILTKKKDNVAACEGYSVRKVGTKYEIRFNGMKPYAPMDAETLYGWMVRLPLNYLVNEADNWRYDIMSA